MSTKTIKQRIATIAASALVAGFLSITSTPVANAAGGDYASSGQTTGSIGLISGPTFADGSTTMTAVLMSTGKLKLTTAATTAYFTVSAGAKITDATDLVPASGLAANQESVVTASGEYFTVTPTGAVGSTFTIKGYVSDGGALTSVITVTIAGTSLSGIPVASESGVFFTTDTPSEVTADSSGRNSVVAGQELYLDIDLEDVYGSAVTATTGALVVTVSAGAYVGLGTSSTVGTFSTAVSSRNPSADYITVTEATAGSGWSGTITVTYNGIPIATKSGTITGYATKLTTSRNKVATAATGTSDAVRFKASDSAGNSVVVTAAQVTLSTSSNKSVVSNVVGATDQVITAGSLADGKATVTCGIPGTSQVVMQYVNPDGVTVKSAPLTVICGASADTYTASWDKASYSQGEIATLTVSFKDIYGAPAASAGTVAALAGTSPDYSNEVISVPMMTRIGTQSTAALTPDENGQLVYKYTVGTATGATPGAYQASVSFPTVNSANGAAQAVSYKINSDGSVSNADVLKSIVALIASINKQIQALQKLILKR
jgi:hypothetical protein